jgi:hypothetical protein
MNIKERCFLSFKQLSITYLPYIKPFVSMKRSIKRKLLRAKIALNTTISRILDINRKRKKLQLYEEIPVKEEELYSELKLLNKIADRQAMLVRKYESSLDQTQANVSAS